MNFTLKNSFLAVPVMLMGILAMLTLPLPAWLIDALFTFNIILALMVLLVAVSARKPLDFSVFPTVLLIATLMRLALNVASTRIVLLEGHTGPDAAGRVIQAFGEVVIGGNYVVGLVIFVILMIVNFFVIVKGGERISEVSARFTLDAMPGKQMAIDADLNAGTLSQEESKKRREEVASEADFYGSMDGASKFVKGDAIAGLLILFINLIGGFIIGMVQHGLPAGESFELFALLTIGDGLVAQIPSLLLATAAAIIVTRVNSDNEMSDQVKDQMLSSPRVLTTIAGIMGILALIPGMPTIPFGVFALVIAYVAYVRYKEIPKDVITGADEEFAESLKKEPLLTWQELPEVDRIRIDLGYELVPMAESSQKGELPNRIRGLRKTISETVGILIPEVRIRDNLKITPNEYRIKLGGDVIAKGSIDPNKLIAIANGELYGKIDGELIKEPAYGIDAVAIAPEDKPKAVTLGYAVHDAATVISTHLGKVIKEHLDELIGYGDIAAINTRLKEISEDLAEALSNAMTPMQQLKIFKKLLADKVSLVDIERIATTLVDVSETTKDPILVASEVRLAIRRSLISQINGEKDHMSVMILSNQLEETLLNAFNQASKSGHISMDDFHIDPELLGKFQQVMPDAAKQMKEHGFKPIMVVHPQLRPLLARYARTFAPNMNVLSTNEIPDHIQLEVVLSLG